MRAYLLRTDTVIEPFGDPAGESRILNETLAEIMSRQLRRLGIEPVPIEDPARAVGDDVLLLPDDLYVTAFLLRQFLDATATEEGTVRLALADSPFTRWTTPLQGLDEIDHEGSRAHVYPLYRVRANALDLEGARPVVLAPRVWNVAIGSPDPNDPDVGRYPVTLAQALRITSWFHVWSANTLGLPVWAVRQAFRPARAIGLVLASLYGLATFPVARALALLTGRRGISLSHHLQAQWVARGRRCNVHPTAVVLASELGDDVEIGPHAHVAFSLVGSGSTIGSHGTVRASVMGERTDLIHGPTLNLCTTYPDARVWGAQASLFGRGSNLGGAVTTYDVNLEGKVRVVHRGALRETGVRVLGVCLGHGARLWGRVALAPGRAFPNGTVITEAPETIAQRIPPDLEPDRLHVVRDGRVVPLRPTPTPTEEDG